MKLESMRRNHLATCAQLYAAVFNSAPWKGKWTPVTAAKHIRESFADPNFRGLVASANGVLIGFAYGITSQWENERHFYLKEMCVSGSKQRGGVGSLLLKELTRRLKAEKVRQIALGTERDKPARRFYLRLGFEINRKVVIMNKRL